MPEDVRDWLWRLDQIEKEMARRIPAYNVHALFTVRTTLPGVWVPVFHQMRTFPNGKPFWTDEERVDWRMIGEDILCLDLGRPDLPFVLSWNPFRNAFSLDMQLPGDDLASDQFDYSNPVVWATWYHLKGGPRKFDSGDQAKWWLAVSDVLRGIIEACHMAPEVVLRNVGDLSKFACWPRALLYLTTKRAHPLLDCRAGLLRGSRGKRGPNPSEWTFDEANERRLQLIPDLRRATGFAFEYFRRVAQAEGRRTVCRDGGQAPLGQAPHVPEIQELEANTPRLPVHPKSKEWKLWASSKEAATLAGLKVRTLATYRRDGIRNTKGTLGRDPSGRVWRKRTKTSHASYLRETLKKQDS